VRRRLASPGRRGFSSRFAIPEKEGPYAGPTGMKLEREAVDKLAREVLELIQRLRPVLDGNPNSWPGSRGRVAANIARDLGAAVLALDVAVEALYLQTDSLEAAHLALEVERRAYQELFERGPDGHLVTDPNGLIIRANGRAGALFACSAEDLVGHPLPALMRPEDRAGLEVAIRELEIAEWDAEWVGAALRAKGERFQMALTAAVVRHADRSVYRVQWSARDISRRHEPD